MGSKNEEWERPTGADDIQDVFEEQIVPIAVTGDWDYSGEKPRYILTNHIDIEKTFKSIYSK